MSDQERSEPLHPSTRTGRAGVLVQLAWVSVLVLTAAFHVVRGAPVDAAVYGVAAALLGLDLLGWLRIPVRLRTDGGLPAGRLGIGVLIAVVAIALALTPLYGGVDTAVVVGIGVLVLPVAWADRGGPPDAEVARQRSASGDGAAGREAMRRAAVFWSLVIAVGCVWEIAAYFLGRGMPAGVTAFPALSDLLDPVLSWPPARAILVALWLLGGYTLLRRGWLR